MVVLVFWDKDQMALGVRKLARVMEAVALVAQMVQPRLAYPAAQTAVCTAAAPARKGVVA